MGGIIFVLNSLTHVVKMCHKRVDFVCVQPIMGLGLGWYGFGLDRIINRLPKNA